MRESAKTKRNRTSCAGLAAAGAAMTILGKIISLFVTCDCNRLRGPECPGKTHVGSCSGGEEAGSLALLLMGKRSRRTCLFSHFTMEAAANKVFRWAVALLRPVALSFSCHLPGRPCCRFTLFPCWARPEAGEPSFMSRILRCFAENNSGRHSADDFMRTRLAST